MESVEVWMWIAAGVVIGGLIFIGSLKLLSNYTQNVEENQLQNNFNLLYSTIISVCTSGLGAREVKSFQFPYIANKIYVKDTEGFEDFGNFLCFDTKERDYCQTINLCNLTMNTIDIEDETSIFYSVQKFLGKKTVAQVKFNIAKVAFGAVNIDWTREVAK